jgi:transcription initiation factor IIF auxiliary subunit
VDFRFDNQARQTGSRGSYRWFDWKVFVNEPMEKLAHIRAVEYRLHETFPNPVRLITDRESRFAMKSSGWGEFTIFITVFLTNGEEQYGEYTLDLNKPWPEVG